MVRSLIEAEDWETTLDLVNVLAPSSNNTNAIELAQSGLSPDAPIRLSTAAKIAFPDGSMTVSGLRREAVRGRLIVERIAGKDFTTLKHIDRMRELCRVRAREPDSIGGKRAFKTESSSAKPFGSSKMEA